MDKPKNGERQQNKENKQLAEKIRANRETELLNGEYNFTPSFVEKTNFFLWAADYVQKNYHNSSKRDFEGVLKHFKTFIGDSYLPVKNLNTELLEGFQHYLKNDSGLKNSTPFQYFAKFKTLISAAQKQKIIQTNPATGIKNPKIKAKPKAWLTFDEIQLLDNTPCKEPDIKKSFLFSCNTGLRHVDLYNLVWKDVDLQNKNARIKQQKTDEPLVVNLNHNALYYLGEKQNPDEKVFPRLSEYTSTDNGKLRTWVKQAGINKNVTYHVGRHTFATNTLLYGGDSLTVSKLLGHTSMKYISDYVKIVESLKNKIVNNLPETKKPGW